MMSEPERPETALSQRWQELFWALPIGEMRSKLRSLEIDVGRALRDADRAALASQPPLAGEPKPNVLVGESVQELIAALRDVEKTCVTPTRPCRERPEAAIRGWCELCLRLEAADSLSAPLAGEQDEPLCVCGHDADSHGNDGYGHCGATRHCRSREGCKEFRAATPAKPLAGEQETTCQWASQDGGIWFRPSCQRNLSMIESGWEHCPFCGRKLVESRTSEKAEL